jgi:hypothetical protein
MTFQAMDPPEFSPPPDILLDESAASPGKQPFEKTPVSRLPRETE